MAVSDVNTKVGLAATSIEAADYAQALIYLRSAKAYLAALPDSAKGDSSLKWRGSEIDALIDECKSASTAATGIQRQGIKYVHPTE